MKKTVKCLFSLVLSLCLVVGMSATAFAEPAAGEGDYAGKTVVLYTGNVRGDVDVYAKIAAAKKAFESKGADVYLADAGNYLQGTTYANTDNGLSVYNLMDKAGYDVAAMGAYDFSWAESSTGVIYHGNLTKYHTQKQLLEGAPEQEYNKNMPGTVKGKLVAKDPASFKVISSNMTIGEENSGFYAFDQNAVFGDEFKVGFAARTDSGIEDMLQDGALKGYAFQDEAALPEADVIIGLSNDGSDVTGAAVTAQAPTDGEEVAGGFVIDEESKAVTPLTEDVLAYDADSEVAALAKTVKDNADEVIGTASANLNGKDSVAWNRETNLGDLAADALYWYASTGKISGYKYSKDIPLVAIQNGGNCDQFIYTGDITKKDLLRAFPFSPFGAGVFYVTGAQLLETLEAGTSPSERYGNSINPTMAQVAGITYNIDWNAEYDKAEANGNWYRAGSINRATILDEDFDVNKTYAVVADNNIFNGMDNQYVFKDMTGGNVTNGTYKSDTFFTDFDFANRDGDLVRDIVAKYIQEELKGDTSAYSKAQGRITTKANDVLTAEQQAKAANDAKEAALIELGSAKAENEKLAAQVKTLNEKLTVTGKQVKGVKAKAGKKSLTISWKSLGKGYKYEVYTSLKMNKGFKKTAASKNKVTVKKLKKGKKYYVKVRGYKTIDGKKVYTAYSDLILSAKVK